MNDECKATGLLIVIDWDRHDDGVFAGDVKRICRAVAGRTKGQSSQDAGSTAEPWRTDETICGHLLRGRRGFFRIAGVRGEVSRYECAFYRNWSAEWSDAGMVLSPAQNVQEDSHNRSASSDSDERR